jgi:hypothetical protein
MYSTRKTLSFLILGPPCMVVSVLQETDLYFYSCASTHCDIFMFTIDTSSGGVYYLFLVCRGAHWRYRCYMHCTPEEIFVVVYARRCFFFLTVRIPFGCVSVSCCVHTDKYPFLYFSYDNPLRPANGKVSSQGGGGSLTRGWQCAVDC